MAGLHEGIHERGQHGAGAENDQRSEEEQQEDQGHEPPFLFLAKKEEELFEQQPHAAGELSRRRASWQTQSRGPASAVDRGPFDYSAPVGSRSWAHTEAACAMLC